MWSSARPPRGSGWCWNLLLIEMAPPPPRRCLARTQSIPLGSPARVGLLTTQSLLLSRPVPPKICGRRPCNAHFWGVASEWPTFSNNGDRCASQLPLQIARFRLFWVRRTLDIVTSHFISWRIIGKGSYWLSGCERSEMGTPALKRRGQVVFCSKE